VVIKLGLLGLSDGNGHPYSWGAIVNGFNENAFNNSNWDVIYKYLKVRDISEFGFDNTKITHVWTQEKLLSHNLAESINAEIVVDKYTDMIGEVDAVIIARDDYENHLEMAQPFLEAGIKVLIDKPLTLDLDELDFFKKYLLSGQLMSVAGLRFAKELDEIRGNLHEFGKLKMIQSSVIMDWEKYGIHIIDGVLGTINEIPKSIEYIATNIDLYVITFESGLVWTINTLGNTSKTFSIEIWGEKKRTCVEISDNFSMFRRMLHRFVKLVKTDKVLYNPNQTVISIALLIAGIKSREDKQKIMLDDIYKQLELEVEQ